MNNAADWELIADDTTLLQKVHRPGKFTLTQLDDPEQGSCLEVALLYFARAEMRGS